MPKPIDEKLVKETYHYFRGPWDFGRSPVLRLPLRRYSTMEQWSSSAPMEPAKMECAEYRIEHGTSEGRKAARIVGTVPGTDISVVVEMNVE